MTRTIIVNGKEIVPTEENLAWYDSLYEPTESDNFWCSEDYEHDGQFFECTRVEDHDGDVHVAHDGSGNTLAVWTDKENPVKVNGENYYLTQEQLKFYQAMYYGLASEEINCQDQDEHTGHYCTREQGHTGYHVAHTEPTPGDIRVVAIWSDGEELDDNMGDESGLDKYKVRVDGEEEILDPEQYEYFLSTYQEDRTDRCRTKEPTEFGKEGWFCTRQKEHTGAHVAHRTNPNFVVLSVWSQSIKVTI